MTMARTPTSKGRTFEQAMLSKIAKVEAAMEQLPEQLNRTSLKHFKKSFQRGGWTGSRFNKWAPKKSGEPSYLTKTRKLREGFKAEEGDNFAKVKNTVGYAIVHNKGLGPYPQRKFIGKSEKLTEEHKRLIILSINTALHG